MVSRRAWRQAAAAGLASYLDAATVVVIAVSLALWRDHYQLTVWQVGVLTFGLAFGVAIGSLVGGWLGDRFGRLRVFSLDLVVFGIGAVTVITAPTGTVLTAGVAVLGLAAGADMPTSLAIIAAAAPDDARGRLIALTQTLWICGILSTYALAVAVAPLGFVGTRVLISYLLGVAVVSLILRLTVLRAPHRRSPQPALSAEPDIRRDVRIRRYGLSLVGTAVFFVFWNTASTTLGTYGPYFLRTVTGLGQARAAVLALIGFVPALIISIIFVRLADSVWRDRLFLVAMIIQIAAFSVGAVTGGTVLAGMVALIVLYSLSNIFAGEAIYKVWTNLLFPADLRSTALGITYGLGRGFAAAAMLVVPLLIQRQPTLLLWALAGCTTVSALSGTLLIGSSRLLASASTRRSA